MLVPGARVYSPRGMPFTVLRPPNLPLECFSEQRLEEEAEASTGTTRQTSTRIPSDDVAKALDGRKEDALSPPFGSSFPAAAESKGAEAAMPTGAEAALSKGGLEMSRQPPRPARAIAEKNDACDSGVVGSKQPSVVPCLSRCSHMEDESVFLPPRGPSLGPSARLFPDVVKDGDAEQQEKLAIVATNGMQMGLSGSMRASVDSLAKFSRFLALLMTSNLLVGPIMEREEKALAELIRARWVRYGPISFTMLPHFAFVFRGACR